MIAVAAVVLFALLFASLAFVRRENEGTGCCRGSPDRDDPTLCDDCPLRRN